MTATMLDGFWESTFAPDPVTGKPFAVDAIISNPPAFGHVHIAEALGVPLMLSFSKSTAHSNLKRYSSISYAMDPLNIIQASTRQHQRDQRREEHDQLAIVRYGKPASMAGVGRYHQCFPKCHIRLGTVDTKVGSLHRGPPKGPLHLLLE